MRLSVNDKLSIPIHMQLKEQLKSLIDQGLYQPEDQMPSVRELAGFLRINRNTAQKAYMELEQEGYVISRTGKGIFVSKLVRDKVNQLQEDILQQTIHTLTQHQLDIQEFAFALLARSQINQAIMLHRPQLLFIECTMSQSKELAEDLANATGYSVTPCLLSDLVAKAEELKERRYDLIVTTFLHVEEVEESIKNMSLIDSPKIVACLLESNILAMKHLQSLPKGSRIGIACATSEGTSNIRKSIMQAGLTHLQLVEGAGDEPDTIPHLLQGTDLVVCSSFVAPMIERLNPEVPVVIDDQTINKQSIQLILRNIQQSDDVEKEIR